MYVLKPSHLQSAVNPQMKPLRGLKHPKPKIGSNLLYCTLKWVQEQYLPKLWRKGILLDFLEGCKKKKRSTKSSARWREMFGVSYMGEGVRPVFFLKPLCIIIFSPGWKSIVFCKIDGHIDSNCTQLMFLSLGCFCITTIVKCFLGVRYTRYLCNFSNNIVEK